MTLTPDRIEEPDLREGTLVFRQEETSLPSSQDLMELMDQMLGARRRAERRNDERRMRSLYGDEYHSDYMDRDWYCYCSPSRGQRLRDMWIPNTEELEEVRRDMRAALASDLSAVYQRWNPPTRVSKELVPVAKPVLDPVEVIPAPKSRVLKLALLGFGMIAAIAFAFDVASAFVH